MHAKSFHECYRALLSQLHFRGTTEINSRTNTEIKMLKGGHSFKLDVSTNLPVAGNRAYWPHIAAAEVAWQFMGTKDPSFIVEKAPKIWSDFVEEGELKTAYGYRWRKHFGRDQIALVVEELASNPTNRQLFVSAWDPANDGLGGPQPKNIPCPVGFSVSRIENMIHMSVFIRSSDVFIGLPYDTMGYALTLDAIASSVCCCPGTLHMTLAHPHIYKPHYDMVQACIEGFSGQLESRIREAGFKDHYDADKSVWTSNTEPALPAWPIDAILAYPEGYIDHMKRLSDRVAKSPWSPSPLLIV